MRTYVRMLSDTHVIRQVNAYGAAACGVLDDAEKDQQADDGGGGGGEHVAPALEPFALDLVAPAGGPEGQSHDRADRGRGEHDYRSDRGREPGGGRGEEHGQ